jgi:hypothetical protein
VSLLLDLLAGLPAGASEAVVSQGLDAVIAKIKKSPGARDGLADDLEAIATEGSPARSIAEISAELSAFLSTSIDSDVHQGHEIVQGDALHSSQVAIGEVGRDLYMGPPRHPHRE